MKKPTPTIINFMFPDRILDEKYLNKLADLILFYWEFRLDKPNIQLAQAWKDQSIINKKEISLEIDTDPIKISSVSHLMSAYNFKTQFIGQYGLVLHETWDLNSTYKIKGHEKYVRVVITGSSGHKAWTQPIFITSWVIIIKKLYTLINNYNIIPFPSNKTDHFPTTSTCITMYYYWVWVGGYCRECRNMV